MATSAVKCTDEDLTTTHRQVRTMAAPIKSKKEQEKWQTVQPRKRISSKASPLQSPSSEGSPSSLPTPTAGGTSDQSLSDDRLQTTAENLHPKKWKPVFRDLMHNKPAGVPSVEVLIGNIEKNHQGDIVEQKYQALQTWKSVMAHEATWEKLRATLHKKGCRYDYEERHHMLSPDATNKSKQEHSGARPKEKQQTKTEVHMAWDGQQLSIKKGTNKETTVPLLGRLDEDGPTSDPIKIADAILVSFINPNHYDNKYKMGLEEVKKRFHHKYGKIVAFKDFGLGGIESFVTNKSRCLKLIEDGEKYFIHEKEGSNRDSDSERDSETESELGDYETAAEMSSTCPSPAYFGHDDDNETPWQLPKKSPRPKKQRQHSTQKKTPARKHLYCQSTSPDELKHLVKKCEGSHLIFRTEVEYTGENSSKVFTKDVVALWNTPRKGSADAYIVVGIKTAPSPPHDLQGLKQTGRVNEDYQEKFMSKSFSYKPQFLYSEAEHVNKTFGVVCIANGKGFGDVCFAEDTCSDGEWSQNDILLRDGSSSVCATRKVQGQIYNWFNERQSVSSPKYHMDKDWELFLEQLDVENHQRRNYCLLVSRCSSETPDLPTLGLFPWFKVWDFDPDSRESGLLAVCEAGLQDRISVMTWKDSPQTSPSNSFTEWLFVRGLRKRGDSLVLGKVKEWGKCVGAALNAQCDQISRICENKPLTVVVLWYGNKDCLRHLHKALGKIDECPCGIKFVICMQKIPDDEGSHGVVKELCMQLEIPKIIEIPLDRLCFGLRQLSCCQRNSVVRLELPGSTKISTLISSRDSQWLQQELDVLYKGDLPTEDVCNQGEAFLKGGILTWQEIQQGVYNAKRTVSTKLNAFLQERLFKGFSCTVSLFHEPGAGGTTLSRQILWDLHEQFPCAVAIADVIDPDEIYQRLEMLYQRTHLPILLLVDGQESRLVKELFAMSHNIHIIILNVQRYTMEIRKKTQQGEKFWLKGEVDKNEADRFRLVFSQIEICKGVTKHKLERMVREVKEEEATHYVYEFGLTVYDTEYIGLRSYVSGYLELKRSKDLATWQMAVGYLALAFYYGHQSIPCQFFSILFGKKESEVVKADDVLTHSGKQFVLEDIRNCTWRITHHAVAKELLEQILYGRENDSKDVQLSIQARRNLKDFAKKFLTYASEKQQKSKLDNTSSIMRIVRGIFIHRDYKDTGQDDHSKRDRLSRLICDIPGSKTSQDQLDLMEHLVECFPSDPTCILHLGRAHIILTQNYDLAQTHLVKARDLRIRERKANQDKYDRMSGDKSSEGISESDSILCTIYHHLGNLSHERIKNLIGGGKLGSKKQYTHSLGDTNNILWEVKRQACTAISHFTNCRCFLSKGMDASYGYIGEINLHLHIADFVENCYKPGGYYGFLTAKASDAELTDFVESCFVSVESLLREYQDLMSLTGQAEAEELDKCQNWFSTIFHDAHTALKYWHGKEGINSNRGKIAVYKLKNQKDHRASARKTPAQILNNIIPEDVQEIIRLYEGIFRDAYMRSVHTDISTDLKDWMVAIRHPQQAAIYSIAGEVLPQVEKCLAVSRSSATALYYLYVLNTTLAVITQQKKYLAESNRLLEKLKKMHSKINRHHRKYAWEWLGVDKAGGSIRRLVHRSCLGVWDSEKRFWQDEKAQEKLQVCTGVIKHCKMPLHGHIGITTGGLTVGHHNGTLEAVFVPKQCGLFGKNYLNTEVEFYVGFNIEHGIEAYNVSELKKYACRHCKITVSVSRLKPSTKICPKCNHAVRVPVES